MSCCWGPPTTADFALLFGGCSSLEWDAFYYYCYHTTTTNKGQPLWKACLQQMIVIVIFTCLIIKWPDSSMRGTWSRCWWVLRRPAPPAPCPLSYTRRSAASRSTSGASHAASTTETRAIGDRHGVCGCGCGRYWRWTGQGVGVGIIGEHNRGQIFCADIMGDQKGGILISLAYCCD